MMMSHNTPPFSTQPHRPASHSSFCRHLANARSHRLSWYVFAQGSHARMLGGAPSSFDIAEYNIILFSSIAMVFTFYFSIMALVNMDVGNDSLLYSKSKSD